MKGQVICMSSFSADYCIVTFKNQKLAKFLNDLIITETKEEEWLITSEDENFIYLGKSYNSLDFDDFNPIDKSRFIKENVRPNNVYVEVNNYHYIDLAKALGLRDTLYGQKGDKRLTKKEAFKIYKAQNYNRLGYIVPLEKGRITKNCERSLRLESVRVKTDEKGITTVHFGSSNCDTALAILKAASLKFPKTLIVVESHDEEWDSVEGGYMYHDIYTVKNGEYKQVDVKWESYDDDDETYGED